MSNEILKRAIRTVRNTLDKARKTGIDPYLAMLSIRATPISDKIPSPALTGPEATNQLAFICHSARQS